MGKGRTLIRSTLLLALSGLALRGLGVLFHSLLAARVGAQGMGILQLVLTVGTFAGTLGSAGIRAASLQLCARAWGRGDLPGAAGALRSCLRYGLLSSALVGGGLVLLSEPVSRVLLREPRTALALRLLGLLLPWTILAGVLGACCTALGRVKELVGVELAERLASAALTFGLLALAGRNQALVCGAVILGRYGAAIGTVLLLWRRLGKVLPGRGLPVPVSATALPLGLNDLLRSGLGTLEQFLIPLGLERHGSREAALAAYGTVSAMVFPLLWFPAELLFALNELLVSELAQCLARGRRARMRELSAKSLALAVLYALGVGTVLWLGGGWLGRSLYHSPQAGRWLRIFSPLVLVLYLDTVVDGIQKGLGQQLWLVRCNSFTNVIDVLGLWLLLPPLGLWGYLITYCLSHLVNLFLSLRRLLTVLSDPRDVQGTGCIFPKNRYNKGKRQKARKAS